MSTIRGILVINPFGIGDVLFSTPLLRTIRAAFPKARIGYLGNRRTEPILRANRQIDELFIYEKDELTQGWRSSKRRGLQAVLALLGQVRRAHFDLAIDLSLGSRYSLVMMLIGIPRRIGFDYRRRGRFLTSRLPLEGYEGKHVVEFYDDLTQFIGLKPGDGMLELTPSPEDRAAATWLLSDLGVREQDQVIGLVPGGGASWGGAATLKHWPRASFALVGQQLAKRLQARPLIFGEASEQPLCRWVAEAVGPEAVDLSGRTTLGMFASLLKRCELVICNDGGPVHLAASQGVRVVAIFGPVNPVVYGPSPPMSRYTVVARDELPCRPCYHRFKLPPCPYERACLTSLSPQTVLDACEDLLRRDSRCAQEPQLSHS